MESGENLVDFMFYIAENIRQAIDCSYEWSIGRSKGIVWKIWALNGVNDSFENCH